MTREQAEIQAAERELCKPQDGIGALMGWADWMIEDEFLANIDKGDLMNAIDVAELCHEANRTYCKLTGDDSQPTWYAAPDWQKTSAINGVKFHLEHPDAGPAASHDNWLAEKAADGWKYGPVKNPDTKEHPCFMPYDGLPEVQRKKDSLFIAIVNCFRDCI